MSPARYTLAALLVLALLPAEVTAQGADNLFERGPHDIHLRINLRDLEALRNGFETNTYYPADVQWGQVVARNIAVRSRGGGSRNGRKLGLRLDMDHFVRGQTFAGLEALVLDNLYQDPSMLREHAAFALFARMGQVAPRTSFARLFINGEYQGAYGLVEEPDALFVTRHFGADTGFLFEFHWIDPYYFDDLGEDLAPYQARFEPRTRDTTPAAQLYAPIRELVREEPGESLDRWRERVSAVIDLDQFITVVAIEQFLSEFDGLLGAAGTNNFYLYRGSNDAKHIVVPWDRDNAFLDVRSSIGLRITENRLTRLALSFPDLQARYLARLADTARQAAQDDWLQRVIEQADTILRAAASTDPRTPYSDADRSAAVHELVEFARQRPAIVLEQVQQLIAPIP